MAKSKTADYGPYHVAGNAWKWCSDWYRALYTQLADAMRYSQQPAEDPTRASFNADTPTENKRVQRGGSFLCTNQCGTRQHDRYLR